MHFVPQTYLKELVGYTTNNFPGSPRTQGPASPTQYFSNLYGLESDWRAPNEKRAFLTELRDYTRDTTQTKNLN